MSEIIVEKVERKRKNNTAKQNVLNFIKWMFEPENRVFVKKSSAQRIADYYTEQKNEQITASIALYHKDRWILINGKPFEKEKIPLDIIKSENFVKFAKENNIEIIEL